MAKYSNHKIRLFLQESDEAQNSDEKGDKLEKLICYIFTKIPGVSFYGKNILDGQRAHELDVVFVNILYKSDLIFLDPTMYVECKHTARPVGSDQVRWFIDKLRDRAANSGILVSLSGITGRQDRESNAHSEVLNALVRDGIKIILIDREDLLSLSTTEDLKILITGKFLKLTVERTII